MLINAIKFNNNYKKFIIIRLIKNNIKYLPRKILLKK